MKGRQLPASAPCMDEAEGEGALGSWEKGLNGGFLLSTVLGLLFFFFFPLHFISIWNLFKLSPKDFFSFLFMGFKLLLCAAMVPESCLI